MSQAGHQQPSPAERARLLREQEERQRRQEDRQMAQNMAQQAAAEGRFAEPGYWDMIEGDDLNRDIDNNYLGEFVTPSMSKFYSIANITRTDWYKLAWQIETEFWTMMNEFRDKDCKLDDVDLATMYPDDAEKPALTDERARQLRSAMQVKKAKTSLGINRAGLDAGTQIHTVSRTESPDREQEEPGFLSRVRRRLV